MCQGLCAIQRGNAFKSDPVLETLICTSYAPWAKDFPSAETTTGAKVVTLTSPATKKLKPDDNNNDSYLILLVPLKISQSQ